jgi:hypothetical protein
MVNEQFTWLTPFSQQAQPELTWRNQRRRGAKNELGLVNESGASGDASASLAAKRPTPEKEQTSITRRLQADSSCY